METNNRYNDEEWEYLVRRERRQQRIKRERMRRRKIRFMIKTGLIVSVLLIIVFAITGFAKKRADENPGVETQEINEPVLLEEEPAAEEPAEAEVTEERAPVYEFHTTGATRDIYSEEVISSHAILIDAGDHTILASKGAKERISPASMTKVLTILVAAEHITEEQLEDTFTMTIEITDYSYVNDCSNVGFLVDEEVKVKDLFYGTILPSGGDAAVGLATYVAGSHEAFVGLMNEKLEELGLSDTAHFTNCVGLYHEDHYCSIYDMAVIMRAAIENDLCREVLAEKCYTTAPSSEHPEGLTISNWFLRRIEDKDTKGEVLGAKTGYVTQSGSCAVSYQRSVNGNLYICATAGSSSSWRCIYDHVEIYNEYVPETAE